MNVALRPQHLDMLSICTGGGGLDLGVGLALRGARSVCLVEREAFAVAHLVAAMRAGLLDDAPIWSDARTFDGRAWRGCIDGLIGGIPCQPHSLAGKRLAEEDERDLWSTARRIIVQARPWFVLIENVGGMLSSGGAERVWRDLRRLGFSVEIGLFAAAEVGASHERERLFILGVADSRNGRAGREPRKLRSAEGCDRSSSADGSERYAGHGGQGLADANLARSPVDRSKRDHARPECPASFGIRGTVVDAPLGDGARPRQPETHLRSPGEGQPRGSGRGLDLARTGAFPPGPHDGENWLRVLARAPELEPAFRRVADGLASRLDLARVDRLRLLGNGVVPLQAGYALRTLATRLARRSAGAGELVRMMGAQP